MAGQIAGPMVEPEYAELHAHTDFSLLDGTSNPEEMVAAGKTRGLRALAITDHDSLAGVVRFAAEAKRQELPAIVGVELTLDTPAGEAHAVLLAQDLTGYRNICALLTEAYQRGGRDRPAVPFSSLAARGAGLIVLSGCPRGELPRALRAGGPAAAREVAGRYRDAFGKEHYFVEVGNHALQADGPRNAGLRAVARQVGVGLVATNDAHYHDRDRALLQRVVTCIRHRTTLEAAASAGAPGAPGASGTPGLSGGSTGGILRANDEYVLKSPAHMAYLFHPLIQQAAEEGRPDLDPLRNTVAIAERCTFRLDDLCYAFPRPQIPPGESDYSFLRRLVEHGKALFYPNASPKVEARLEHELALVEDLGLAGYLLVFKEVVDWSLDQGIICSIRGSAPASALLYCLGLCPIDPVEHDLLFERFCSPERRELPDIDLDFPHERREEVIQYVYEKYGRDRVAMVCEVNTYRTKSALRDVAKVLGLSPQRAQQLADQVEWDDPDPRDRLLRDDAPDPRDRKRPDTGASRGAGASAPGSAGEDPPGSPTENAGGGPDDGRIEGRTAELLIKLAMALRHHPRHHSIHVGGMVVSDAPLTEVTSIEPARMPGRTILPWDKDDLTTLAEEFGINLIKMDFLGLGMLSLIGRCFEHVRAHTGERLSLHGFRYDPAAFRVLSKADTVGLFQVESRAQQSFLPRLRPKNLADVAISVGAIRPGPGAARAGEHIVRRRQRRERISYPAPTLEPVLRETYGVLLWQEQCIQVAVTAAGYTPGEGDQLRRAMSHKRSYERLEALTAELVERMAANGYPRREAEAVRRMIVGFAGYGFPRSHAYAFAHLALISATLRLRYPAAYYAALLNCQPMGFYAPHTIIWDAHRHGVVVLPVDVNRSEWECTLEKIAGGAEPPRTPPEGRPQLPEGYRWVPGSGQGTPPEGAPAAPGTPASPVGEGAAPIRPMLPAPPRGCRGTRSGACASHHSDGPAASRAALPRHPRPPEATMSPPLPEAGARAAGGGGRGGEGAPLAIRLGLKEVDGLGEAARAVFDRERARGPFRSLADFVARTGFDRETLERLAEVGAFLSLADGLAPDRRAAVWATGELAGFGARHLPGLAPQLAEPAALPPMTDWEELQADYRGIGFSIGRHVVAAFRPRLNRLGARTATDLVRTGKRGLVVRAGGLVIVRQRPETASHLVFLTLEDETGLFNAIVYPQTYERLRRVLRGEPLILLEGPLQVQDGVVHLLVRRAWSLTRGNALPRVRSHDFH